VRQESHKIMEMEDTDGYDDDDDDDDDNKEEEEGEEEEEERGPWE